MLRQLNLRLTELSSPARLAAFIVRDHIVFGENMQKTYLPAALQWQGKTVLVVLGRTTVHGLVACRRDHSDVGGVNEFTTSVYRCFV